MELKTADLCDEFESLVLVAEPLFRDYGGITSFYGRVSTVRVFEDNVLVCEALEVDGQREGSWSWTAGHLGVVLW